MRPLQHWLPPRYTLSKHHSGVSPLLQPLDGPCFSTGKGAPRTSVPTYCCHNRCLQHGLRRYMQWAGSLGALDRAPTALAHQLPRAFGSVSSLTAVLATTDRQACVSSHGQHCSCLVHQPAGRNTSVVTRSSNHCALSTSQGSSIVQPMHSHDSSRSPENGNSIPRRSG